MCQSRKQWEYVTPKSTQAMMMMSQPQFLFVLLVAVARVPHNVVGAEKLDMEMEPVDTSHWTDPWAWDTETEPVDTSHWTDPWAWDEGTAKKSEGGTDGPQPHPHSMKDKLNALKRDRSGTKSSSKPARSVAPPTSSSMIEKIQECSSCAHCNTKLRECRERFGRLQNSTNTRSRSSSSESTGERIENAVTYTSSDALYLHRHVNFLVRRLSLAEHATLSTANDARFSAELLLSPSDIRTLVDFASDAELFGEEKRRTKMAEIDDILSRYLDNVVPFRSHAAEVNNLRDYSSTLFHYLPSAVDLTCALLASVTFAAFYFAWGGVPLSKVLVTSAIILMTISSAWHWVHLYKKAVSKHHAAIMENQKPPKECFPEKMSLSDLFFNAVIHASYSANDKCSKYHEALMVDPFWEVSPTMAVVETFTAFVLLPLEHLGRNLGKFFSSLVAELPIMSQFYVIPVVLTGFLLIVIMVFRYKINLPFWLGSIEPQHMLKSPKRSVSVEEEFRLLKEAYYLQQEKIKLLETVRSGLVALEGGTGRVQEIECLEKQEVPPKAEESPSIDGTDQCRPVLSPPQGWKDAAPPTPSSVTLTPRKKLVAVGQATSPVDTAFEWVPEPKGDESADPEEMDLFCAAGDGDETDDVNNFLCRVETVFQREQN